MCVNLQAVLWYLSIEWSGVSNPCYGRLSERIFLFLNIRLEKLVKIVENSKLSLLHLLSKVPHVINKQVFSQVNYAGRQTIKPV
jgi:hypothetical protein